MLPGCLGGEAAELYDLHPGFIGVEALYGRAARVNGHPSAFLRVDAYAYYYLVEDLQTALHYGVMAYGEGVEGACEQGYAWCSWFCAVGIHLTTISESSSTTRLSMMKFWRSDVFLPM